MNHALKKTVSDVSFVISEIRVFPIDCHAALSKTKSQIRIVILREAKRSRRIYRRTDDGFCNSGRKRPPSRMTRWMDDNELKDPRFSDSSTSTDSRIFPINTLYWPSHSARSNAESQNLIVILCSVNPTPRIYWRTHDGFCNSGQWTSSVQNDMIDGRQWI